MTLNYLNQFPVENITLNMNGIQFALLLVGALEFLLLHIFLDKKKIHNFFSTFQSAVQSQSICPIEAKDSAATTNEDIEEDKRIDQQSVCRGGDMEVVFRSLGMVSNSAESQLPARSDVYGLYDLFEERNPSLGEVREAFDVFDENRDGFIDEEELQKVLCALGLKEGSEVENCRRMIGMFDENGDGRIEFDEFVKLMEI